MDEPFVLQVRYTRYSFAPLHQQLGKKNTTGLCHGLKLCIPQSKRGQPNEICTFRALELGYERKEKRTEHEGKRKKHP